MQSEERQQLIKQLAIDISEYAYEDIVLALLEQQDEIYALEKQMAKIEAKLKMAGNACGVAATFLEFHGRPSNQLKNCIEMMKKHESMALDKDE